MGERAAGYEAIEVSSRRFELHVYDPERTELDVSGVEDEVPPDPVGKFDAVEVQYLLALGMLRDRPADHERQCVRLQGLWKVSRGCWAERRTSTPTLRSCSMGQPIGKKPGRVVESVVRLCE